LTTNAAHSSSPTIPVSALAISGEGDGEEGTYLAAGQDDSRISIWNITAPDWTERRLETLRGHGKAITSLAFAGNKVLVSGSAEGKVCTWRLVSFGLTRVHQWWPWAIFEGHVGPVLTVAIDFRGLIAASGGEDGTAQLWELSSGRCIHKIQGHNSPIYGVSFSHLGSFLAIGSGPSRDMTWERLHPDETELSQAPGKDG